MGIQKVTILLERPDVAGGPVFRPGEHLVGAVRLKITGHKPHKLSQLLVKLRGNAVTRWEETSGSGDSQTSTTYSETQHLLRVDVPLVKDGQLIHQLTPGEHTLPFGCQLSEILPPTLKIGAGKVKYLIKARAISAGLFSFNGKSECSIQMLPHLDLNFNPRLSRPLTLSGMADKPLFGKSVGQFQVYMEKQGYVPGETIHVYVDGADRLMQSLEGGSGVVKLKRKHVCTAGKRHRDGKTTLQVVKPRDWRHIQMVVPSDAQISVEEGLCRIINVTYYIKIKSSPLKLRLHLVIGTVPLRPS